MRRMIPIRLKPNSEQAQHHISSAILFFVFSGRSWTTCFPFFFFIKLLQILLVQTPLTDVDVEGMYIIIVQYASYGNASRASISEQQLRCICEETKAAQKHRPTWQSTFKGKDCRDNYSAKSVCNYTSVSVTDAMYVIGYDVAV